MTTASAPRGRPGLLRASGSSRARPGAHAGQRRRRAWLAPVVALVAVLLVVASWQALQTLLPAGSPSPASSQAPSPSVGGPVGIRTEVSIGDTGGMHVVETLTFATPQARLDLSVPRRSGVGRDFLPVVEALIVQEPAPTTRVGSLGIGEEAAVDLATPSTRIVLEYDAAGVVVRSGDPSAPERALALVTPLVIVQAHSLPSTVEVMSVKVLNVGCLRGDQLTGCGTRTDQGWTVESSGGEEGPRADVFAQLDLAVP